MPRMFEKPVSASFGNGQNETYRNSGRQGTCGRIQRERVAAHEKDKLFAETFTAADAHALAKKLCADFVNGDYDILGIVGTHYVSVLKQEPYVNFVFPLTKSKNKKNPSAIFEPDESTILETAIPEYVAGLITSAVRESFLCELASRRMAMDNADKNAEAMIEDLRLKYNRARQGAITQEITEIVAGSDA